MKPTSAASIRGPIEVEALMYPASAPTFPDSRVERAPKTIATIIAIMEINPSDPAIVKLYFAIFKS